MTTPTVTTRRKSRKKSRKANAESLARLQRETSVSEYFAKEIHQLGFGNTRKAMLTTVKEAVDNGLDACEDAGILPHISVRVQQVNDTRYTITVLDNGPGILRSQMENIFGKLLYGSKFHQMKMSRGQQGIGISAAGMYGLTSTGKPMHIISKTGRRKRANAMLLKMDTSRNRAEVVSEGKCADEKTLFPEGHGTQVIIELEGKYLKGRQSIDEYIEQTAIVNPHARFTYEMPSGEILEYARTVDELPEETRAIKPHPRGVERGVLIGMLEKTEHKKLGAFLQKEFCRVGQQKAKEISSKAGLSTLTWINAIGHEEAEKIFDALQEVKLIAPPTDCLSPIGTQTILQGLTKEVPAEFYAAETRSPTVCRGNPFQIEVAIAWGGKLAGDDQARILRFANRVPLLYQQSACASFRSVCDTNWKSYGLSQPKGSLPVGPIIIMVHIASVSVPYTSAGKEAIADYDEIRKEMKRALQRCGKHLGTYLRRRKRMQREAERRDVFERYIGEVAKNCAAITGADAHRIHRSLTVLARLKTEEADVMLDKEGRVIDDGGRLAQEENVVIVNDCEEEATVPGQKDLFGAEPSRSAPKRRKVKKAGTRIAKKKGSKKGRKMSTPRRKKG